MKGGGDGRKREKKSIQWVVMPQLISGTDPAEKLRIRATFYMEGDESATRQGAAVIRDAKKNEQRLQLCRKQLLPTRRAQLQRKRKTARLSGKRGNTDRGLKRERGEGKGDRGGKQLETRVKPL